METLAHRYRSIEKAIFDWMVAHAILLLRLSLGIVFLWFGALKFVPSLSPAEGLASETMARLTLGALAARNAVLLLAVWETLIGLALLFGFRLRAALVLLFLQMGGTLTPLILFPSATFVRFPFVPTMEGQYILKNLVLVSAAIVIAATVGGAKFAVTALAQTCCVAGVGFAGPASRSRRPTTTFDS